MKRIILIALFSLLCVSTFAQKIKFTNNTNRWSMLDSTLGCCIPVLFMYTTAHYDGRTKFHGTTYQNLFYDFGSCLVREEGKRVYVIGTRDSTERVLYDFNLKLNDTLTLVYPQNTFKSWVAQLDSTNLYGTWYKVWHFEGLAIYPDSQRAYQYNVIEGIGCTNGVYYPASPYNLVTYSDQLLCFTNDMGFNTPLSVPVLSYGYGYTNSFDNYVSCNNFHAPPPTPEPEPIPEETLRAQQLAQQSGNAVVIPNPVNDNSKIVLPYSIGAGTVTVMNELGQSVMNTSFQNKGEMLIGNSLRAPGLYFYRVIDNQTGKVFAGKFVNP